MMRKVHAIASGFTLLEVIIAGLLLSIVGAGTLAAFSASHQLLLSAQYRLEAMYTARQFLETYETTAFDNLVNSVTVNNIGTPGNPSNPPRQVTTTIQNGLAGTDYKTIIVQVVRQQG